MEKRGGTKHCCYGLCNSDSRYSYKPHMKNVGFVRFPKPWIDLEKCKKWVKACGRGDTFTTKNVNNSTFICTKHFFGENGPTDDHPDPIPASFTPIQIEKLAKKRKPPSLRSPPPPKRKLMETISKATSDEQDNLCEPTDVIPCPISSSQQFSLHKECQVTPESKDAQVQTKAHLTSDLNMETRIENKLLQNENRLLKSEVELLKSKLAKETKPTKTAKYELRTKSGKKY